MLLLEYKKREGEVISFKVKDDYYLKFAYKINRDNDGHVSVSLEELTNKDHHNYPFQIQFPCTKSSITKCIGVWARNNIWMELTPKEYYGRGQHDGYYQRNFDNAEPTAEAKKRKSFVYLRSKKIGEVLGGVIWREILMSENVSDETMYEIGSLAWRVYPRSKKMVWAVATLYQCYRQLSPDVWRLIKSDILKYNSSLTKYILLKIHLKQYKVSTDEYIKIIKDSPDIVRKCRYGFEWNDRYDDIDISKLSVPENRWQWFTLRVAIAMGPEPTYPGYEKSYSDKCREIFVEKLQDSDIKMWHYYKKVMHISKPYSFREIHHMIQSVSDGARIYHNYADNEHEIAFVPIEGSAMRMMRNALYNHNQEKELNKKNRLSVKDHLMPLPIYKLPDWLEEIRIKSAHAMIQAGIDCEHCIGSYADSHDMFFRTKDDICAQVHREKLYVIQCFGVRDQITKESEAFKDKLNEVFAPMIENTHEMVV